MTKVFVNKDAQFLYDLSQKQVFEPSDFYLLAKLAEVAERLESLDEKSAGAYSQGFREGRESALYSRSNIAKSEGTYPNLEEALKAFRGEVTKIPPAKKAKTAMKEVLTLEDLDLDF